VHGSVDQGGEDAGHRGLDVGEGVGEARLVAVPGVDQRGALRLGRVEVVQQGDVRLGGDAQQPVDLEWFDGDDEVVRKQVLARDLPGAMARRVIPGRGQPARRSIVLPNSSVEMPKLSTVTP
jgi:hypothetical protein